MTFTFSCFAISHIGNWRKNNEDNFFVGEGAIISREEQSSMSQSENRVVRKSTCLDGSANRIYAVSDGMGGHKNGEVASRMVVEALEDFSRQHRMGPCCNRQAKYNFIQDFQDMICQTNAMILGATGDFDVDSMGATLSGVLFFADEAVVFNIGDSSTFLCENGNIQKLTIDDNEAERFQDIDLTLLESRGKRLTKYFGLPRSCGRLTARISSPITLRSGQIYIVASDGLTDYLRLEEMAEEIKVCRGSPSSISEHLVERALDRENGGHDNITVVVLKVL